MTNEQLCDRQMMAKMNTKENKQKKKVKTSTKPADG